MIITRSPGFAVAAVILCFFSITVSNCFAQDYWWFEYFFDTDPGLGNGTMVSYYYGQQISATLSVNTSGLTSGFHRLYIRARDNSGRWSIPFVKTIHVFTEPIVASPNTNAIEYFFDLDPGIGNGVINEFANYSPVLNQTLTVDVTGLSPGFHTLYVRSRNADGIWSIPYSKKIHVIADVPIPTVPDIVGIEYYLDDDPGLGLGLAIPVSSSSQPTVNFTVDLSEYSLGEHHLYIRAKDAFGKWSIVKVDTITLAGNYKPFVQHPIPDYSLPMNFPYMLIRLDTIFSDNDLVRGDSLRYCVFVDGQSATGIMNGRWLNLDPVANRSGVTAFIVTATDDSNQVARDTFYIDVQSAPDPPRATSLQANAAGEDVRLSWTRVSQTALGNPIDVQRYLVYFKNTYSSPYWNFLGATYHQDSLTYVHQSVIRHSKSMYYLVRAWIGNTDSFDRVVPFLTPGISEMEVIQNIYNFDQIGRSKSNRF